MAWMIALDESGDSHHTFVIVVELVEWDFPRLSPFLFSLFRVLLETPFSRSRRSSNQVLA